ncbi:hypothetical protein C2S53_013769 [Perilla frutescens var. hirtella]|uniref:RING-type E3 ubiquitin transferase n=1 Tax=Perilla frutescens var. hirtella TaxID=608512 RepID=A0AAD4P6X5_PERFH|nr:hypothetical protein C2S53_013769 [Perilla frutescens var. hirtella]
MLDPPTSPTIPVPPPPPSLPKSNLPMLYYGLVVVATAAIVLVLYNLIVVKWCSDLPVHRQPQRSSPPSWRINNNAPMIFVSSFKYKRDAKAQDGDSECAVCLSVFEEGEEIRQLPKCKHYFHAPCIDMWLYSHLDCPLCRSLVEPPLLHHHAAAEESEHSRQGLLV